MKKIFFTFLESPIGLLSLASNPDGLCELQIMSPRENRENREKENRDKKTFSNQKQAIQKAEDPILQKACEELNLYFQGTLQSFSTQLDIQGTPFQKKVWKALLEIPYGEHVSYQDIALRLGSPKWVRAVGGANHRNRLSIFIPCHRVLYKNGCLGGYGSGTHIKEWLLNHEKQWVSKS